ncbi:MAG: cytochrome c [Chloroflexi bacterium]|nr:cytochrome c [Chloroflexota bacterium]
MKLRMFVLLSALVLVALALSACGGGAGSPAAPAKSAGDPAKGKTRYDSTCTACHGADLKGITGLGKDLTTSTFVKGQSDVALVDFIKKGRSATDPANTTKVDMPAKGGNPALTDADLGDIVAYIRSLQK